MELSTLKPGLLGVLASVCMLLAVTTPTWAAEPEAKNIGNLSLHDLGAISVPDLAEIFDVFDVLLNPPRVSVAGGGNVQQSPGYTPAITSVVTAQDIEAMGANNLDDVLRTVPGLYVGVSSNGNYIANYSMRGIRYLSSQGFLILLNGVPLKHLFSNNAWSILHNGRYPVHNIARVEIIRGTASALYGADAVSGVINIVTKNAKQMQGGEAGVRVGSFNSENAWLQQGGKYADFEIAASLEYQQSDGAHPLIEADLQSYYDQRDGTHISATPADLDTFSRQFQAAVEISRGHWNLFTLHREHRHSPGLLTRGLMPVKESLQDIDLQVAKLEYHDPELSSFWDVRAALSLVHFSWEDVTPRHLFAPGALGNRFSHGQLLQAHIQELASRFEGSMAYSGMPDHYWLLTGGYSQADMYEVEQFTTAGTHPTTGKPIKPEDGMVNLSDSRYLGTAEGRRDNWWFLLQDTWSFANDWNATAGLRYDKFTIFGNVWTPRFSLGWQMRQDLSARLMYSQAFMAPSLGELTASLPPLVGNPNLNPMTNKSLELAINYQAHRHLNFALNLFAYQQCDQIEYVPSSVKDQPTYVNQGKAHGQGFEFEMRWRPNKSTGLLMNYAFSQSYDELQQSDLTEVPNQSFYVRHDWLFYPRWYLDTQVYWVGDFKRAANDWREKPDAQFSLDFSLRYKPATDINLAAGVRNATNADNRDPSPGPNQGIINYPYDFPLIGRTWFMELSYHFD